METAISVILGNPTRYQPVGEEVRIFRVKRFPYYIYYQFRAERQYVWILAVMHCKKRPDYWRNRLNDPN